MGMTGGMLGCHLMDDSCTRCLGTGVEPADPESVVVEWLNRTTLRRKVRHGTLKVWERFRLDTGAYVSQAQFVVYLTRHGVVKERTSTARYLVLPYAEGSPHWWWEVLDRAEEGTQSV